MSVDHWEGRNNIKEFIRKHDDRMHGVVSGFDHMLFRGYLPMLSGRAMAQFLDGLDLQGWTLNIPRYVLPPLEEDIPPLSEAIEALKTALNRCREAEARHERGRVVDPASVVYTMDVRLKQESVHHANRAYFY